MPRHLYHVTFLHSLDAIASKGLVPGAGQTFGGGYAGHSRGRVFLTEWDGVRFWMDRYEQLAHHHTDNPEEGWVPVALRIDTRGLDPQPDEAGSRDAMADAYFVEGRVPAGSIDVWHDGWQSLASVDPDAMQDEVMANAEVEEDDGERWYEVDFEMFTPTRKASPARVALRHLSRAVVTEMSKELEADIEEVVRLRRTGAQVGTDTAEIYAIAPEQLYHIVQDGEWKEWADVLWGEKDADDRDVDEALKEMERIVTQHGGAYFHTGADGGWEVSVEMDGMKPTEEQGSQPPYGTPEDYEPGPGPQSERSARVKAPLQHQQDMALDALARRYRYIAKKINAVEWKPYRRPELMGTSMAVGELVVYVDDEPGEEVLVGARVPYTEGGFFIGSVPEWVEPWVLKAQVW